jgi:hypothetical protein
MTGEANGKIPSWVIMMVIGAVSVAGSFVTTLLNANSPQKSLDDIHNDIKDLRLDLRANYLTKDEHKEFLRRTDEHIIRLDGRIDKVISEIVPRPENEAKWDFNAQQLADLRKQIDDLRRLVGTDYTLRDKIIEMQSRIDSLTNRLLPTPSPNH